MGCEMFVTRLPKDLLEEPTAETVYRSFASPDELFALCHRLDDAGVGEDSELLCCEEHFFLVLRGDCPRFIYDYGDGIDGITVSYISEYARPILQTQAVPRLASLFS